MNSSVLILPLALALTGCATASAQHIEVPELIGRANERGGLDSTNSMPSVGELLMVRRMVGEYDPTRSSVTRTPWSDAPLGFQRVAPSLIRNMRVTNDPDAFEERIVDGIFLFVTEAVGYGEDPRDDPGKAILVGAIALPLVATSALIYRAALGTRHPYVLEPDGFDFFEEQMALRRSFVHDVASTQLGQ